LQGKKKKEGELVGTLKKPQWGKKAEKKVARKQLQDGVKRKRRELGKKITVPGRVV